jgi:hypothetical protein
VQSMLVSKIAIMMTGLCTELKCLQPSEFSALKMENLVANRLN